jgi:hypothetical protein
MRSITKIKLVGTLLGLSMTASIIAAHAADLTGKWASGGGSGTIFTFDGNGDQFTGKISYQDRVYKIVDGALDGDSISFFVLHDADWDEEVKANGGKPFRNTAKGTISDDEISVSGSRENHPDIRPYTLTLHRLAVE